MAKKAAREKKVPIFVPEGFTDFACDMCGDCCEEPERVLISAAKYERLVRVLRDTGFHIPPGDALMREREEADEPAAFALVGDRCVFLTTDRHCHLCNIGVPELRGLRCVSFPVSPIVTPRGINYSVSFACRKTASVLRSRKPLNLLAVTVDEPLVPPAEPPFTSRHRIPSVGGRPKLDWTAHRLVEGLLLAVARDWDISTADRLVLLPIVLNYLLSDYTGPEADSAVRERVQHIGRRLPGLLDEARSLGPDPARHYEALSGVLGRRIGLRSRARLRKVVDDALRQVRGQRTKITGAELGTVLAQMYGRYYKPAARRFEHVLGNYILCRLFANREMLTGGVYKGVYTVCYLVALARFFATAAAAEHHRRVDEDGIVAAVRVGEKLFAQSRNAFDFLDAPEEQRRMQDPATAAVLARI